ncbi:MAG: hypothetical protein ABIQ16_27660 [Polyangiaceae bacterium]
MRRFSMFLGSAIAAAIAVAGCGSDNDSGSQNAPGQCVGTYSDFTTTQFDDQTTSGKGCSLDAASICSNDVTSLVGTCGKTCYLQAAQDDASQAACVSPCIMQKVTSPKALSDSCVDCYVEDVACARDKCFAQCGLTPGSPDCAKCRVDNGCASTFYGCSGLPLPAGVALGGDSAGANGSGN